MTKGTVVLATVYGDVHDIGKNLVNTILSNNGYTVHDLGKQVPVNRIIDKAVEVDATAIGLSALLVSTSKQMPLCVQELHRAGLPLSGDHRRRGDQSRLRAANPLRRRGDAVRAGRVLREGCVRGAVPDGPPRRSRDAAAIWSGRRRKRRGEALGRPGRTAFSVPEEALDTGGSTVRDVEPISPPFWGAREMDRVELSDVWPHLDLKTLFRLHWGGKGVKDEAWEELQRDEFLPRLAPHAARSDRAGVVAAQGPLWLLPGQPRRQRSGGLQPGRGGAARSRGSPSHASRAGIDSAWPTTTCHCRQDGETWRSSRS